MHTTELTPAQALRDAREWAPLEADHLPADGSTIRIARPTEWGYNTDTGIVHRTATGAHLSGTWVLEVEWGALADVEVLSPAGAGPHIVTRTGNPFDFGTTCVATCACGWSGREVQLSAKGHAHRFYAERAERRAARAAWLRTLDYLELTIELAECRIAGDLELLELAEAEDAARAI